MSLKLSNRVSVQEIVIGFIPSLLPIGLSPLYIFFSCRPSDDTLGTYKIKFKNCISKRNPKRIPVIAKSKRAETKRGIPLNKVCLVASLIFQQMLFNTSFCYSHLAVIRWEDKYFQLTVKTR